jgi:hypothetical protein
MFLGIVFRQRLKRCALAIALAAMPLAMWPAPAEILAGTARLEPRSDFPALVVRQWDAFLLEQFKQARAERVKFWRAIIRRPGHMPARCSPTVNGSRESSEPSIGAWQMGLRGVCQSSQALHESRRAGSYGNRILRWAAHHPRRGDVRFSSPASAMAFIAGFRTGRHG